MRARIGGFTFEGGEGDLGWFLDGEDGLQGWLAGVGVRRDRVEFQRAHGSYDLPGFRDSRVIVLQGLCHTGSLADQEHEAARLAGLLSDGQQGRLYVDETARTLWADVRLGDGGVDFTPIVPGTLATFRAEFWAADPRRYGDTQGPFTGSSVDVYHYGNHPASPVITISGSGTNTYWVNGPDGRRWEVTADLESGHPHTLDIRTGHLIVDGFVIVGGLNRADTWTVPGGTKVNHSFDANGNTATMSIRVTDTYL